MRVGVIDKAHARIPLGKLSREKKQKEPDKGAFCAAKVLSQQLTMSTLRGVGALQVADCTRSLKLPLHAACNRADLECDDSTAFFRREAAQPCRFTFAKAPKAVLLRQPVGGTKDKYRREQ